MRKIKATAAVIALALAGVVCAAGNMQETKNAPDKEKAAACCSAPGESCCAKENCRDKSERAEACCAATSEDAQAGEKRSSRSCCKIHATGDTQAAGHSPQAGQEAGASCCANCESCCKDGACSKSKVAKQ